jgi:hypothetical protein
MNNSSAIVVVPPLSPSDTNPPLGPYILRRGCERAGIEVAVADLSVAYVNRFKGEGVQPHSRVLGDQDKDRAATHAARNHFIAMSPLSARPAIHAPDAADPVLGMHYGFSDIHDAVVSASRRGTFWRTFLDEHLFTAHAASPPSVLGLSIMGPPQVFVSLVVGYLARLYWPNTRVVAGGSHITLLADEIAREPQYGEFMELFMFGHCENEFAELVSAVMDGRPHRQVTRTAGNGLTRCHDPQPFVSVTTPGTRRVSKARFDVLPAMYAMDIVQYEARRVTLPLQLTRGCTYGRCTYCTYPAVESEVNATPDWARVIEAISTLVARTGITRFSFKDSFFTPKNLNVFCDQLVDANLSITWSATTLLHDRLTPGLLSRMHGAGCRTLEVGLETIDERGQALFDKPMELSMIERVLDGATQAGIAVVVNQIFGLPGQTAESADRQVDWYRRLHARSGGLIVTSCNMLEINRASPMAADAARFGVELRGIAPWAFSYDWDAPEWRMELQEKYPDLFPLGPPRIRMG